MRNRDRQAAIATLTDDLATVTNQYMQATKYATEWSGRGYPTNSLGGGAGSGTSDPVLRTVLVGQTDAYTEDLKRADQHLRDAVTQLAWLARFTRRNMPQPPEKEPTDCIVCGRFVARTAKDPLRRGRCSACNSYLRRHGKDRPKAEPED